MEGGGLAAIVGVVSGVIATLATAIGTYLTLKHKHKVELEEMEHKHKKEEHELARINKKEESADNMQARKARSDSDARAVVQYKELIDRLEKRDTKWEEDSKSKQKLIDELVERDTLCQVRLHRQYGWMQQAFGWMKRPQGELSG